jgi:hypothetical protein
MKKKAFVLIGLFLMTCGQSVLGQISINNTGADPHTSAMLDVSSTTKGALVPRMSLSQRQAISLPAQGLLVYQKDGNEGFYYYDGISWERLSTKAPLWDDQGSYLEPLNISGDEKIKVANDASHLYGFYSDMNTGSGSGYGGYFKHISTGNTTTGIYASSSYTGASNPGVTQGAKIESFSTTQHQYGINNYAQHFGPAGLLVGINNFTHMMAGNSGQVSGIKSYSLREGAEEKNYGIYSSAINGTSTYGVYGYAEGGASNYGLYGTANDATLSVGVLGEGFTWGGDFRNIASSKTVKLGGNTYALQIIDGNEATNKVLTSDASGNATWQSLPSAFWIDHGTYLSPSGPVETKIRVADDTTGAYGFYTRMNTGAQSGCGAQINHTNTSGDGCGINIISEFKGSNNDGSSYGAKIFSSSTTQDQTGIHNYTLHSGLTGSQIGIENIVYSENGHMDEVRGIKSTSLREADNNLNYGIYSKAAQGTIVYAVYGEALNGVENYGLYGEARFASTSIGVYGEGDTWGGMFSHHSNGKSVKLGGSSLAIEATGDIKLNSTVDAFMIGSYDVLHIPGNVNNISAGAGAGPAVTTGQHNAFFGFESGLNNAGAWDNTFIGYKAGRSTSSGNNNTFIGSAAGYYHTQGTYNTYLGFQAGYSNSTPGNTPTRNTIVGGFSGYSNASGSYNTYVGYESGRNASAGDSSVFIGYQAGYSETQSQKLYIHNSSGSDPLIYGEFDNSILKFNGRLGIQTDPLVTAGLHVDHDNYYAGYFSSDYGDALTHVVHAVYDGTTEIDATAVYGESTPGDNTNTGIGGEFNGNLYGVYGYTTPGTSSGAAYGILGVCYGNAGFRYAVAGIAYEGNTRYGIYGEAAAQTNSYAVYCNGNGVYTGTWNHSSDRKLKKNIFELHDALTIIKQLKPTSYEFRLDKFEYIHLSEGKHYGFIAQQLEEVLPELVGSAKLPMSDDKNPPMFEFKTTNTIELIPVLTRAIQEQQAMIEKLQEQVNQLLLDKE